jgi:hypothetical protein
MTTESLVAKVKQEFPDFFVDYNYEMDGLVLIKYSNGHRFRAMIERNDLLDSHDPIEVVRYRIGMWTNTTASLPQKGPVGAVGSTTLPYNPSRTYPPYDPFEEAKDVEEFVSQTKSFTPSDIIRINDVKARVKQHIDTYFSLIRNTFEPQKYVVAGGCFASLFHNEDPKDYDFFLLNSLMNSEAINIFKKDHEKNSTDYGAEYRIGDMTYIKNDKITDTITLNRSNIQIINTKYNTREELVNHFDFKHCCVSYDFFTDKLYISRDAYDAIMNKMLIPNDPKKQPAHWRYQKFFAKGWKGEIFFQEVA